jgi:hypothetical protein
MILSSLLLMEMPRPRLEQPGFTAPTEALFRRGFLSVHKCREHSTKYISIIYLEYHSACPFVGIGTLPPPLSPASVHLPPEPKGGAHSPAGKGLGSPYSDDWRKSLALCLLCGAQYSVFTRPAEF